MFAYTEYYGVDWADDAIAHICASFSLDEGETWSHPIVILEKDPDAENIMSPSLFNIADGRLGMTYLRKFELPDGALTCMPMFISSCDNGKTWSEKYAVPVNNVHGPTLLQDGSLLWVGREKSGNFVQTATFGDKVKAFASHDNGLTWQLLSQLPEMPGMDQRRFHEVHSIQTADGMIISQIRCDCNTGCIGETYTLQTESYDGGRTWGPYRRIFDGYPTHLLKLSDGRLLTTYGWRQRPFGIRCRFGLDLPQQFWEEEVVLTDDGESLDLGYPSTVQLDDGSFVTLWYQFRSAEHLALLRWLKWRA